MLPKNLSNFRVIRSLYHPISRLRDFTRFGGKKYYRLVNRETLFKITIITTGCHDSLNHRFISEKMQMSGSNDNISFSHVDNQIQYWLLERYRVPTSLQISSQIQNSRNFVCPQLIFSCPIVLNFCRVRWWYCRVLCKGPYSTIVKSIVVANVYLWISVIQLYPWFNYG